MRILKLSASFGSLQNAELTLDGGLNVITAPNESGKSTWAAFLMAMLYGVDSSERTTKTNLPVKTKFKPWSGAPMEGRMELEWQGKRITIERSTKGRVPMGEFRAYETASGQAVAGMTGENCGELLLGVSRSVFERSAFIGQGAMALTSDAELEKRLSSMKRSASPTHRKRCATGATAAATTGRGFCRRHSWNCRRRRIRSSRSAACTEATWS